MIVEKRGEEIEKVFSEMLAERNDENIVKPLALMIAYLEHESQQGARNLEKLGTIRALIIYFFDWSDKQIEDLFSAVNLNGRPLN